MNIKNKLHERLEEAADKYALGMFDEPASRTGFIYGAEYGCKEVIEQVKEWWKHGSVWLDLMNVKDSNDLGDLINTFESDMNKLWED